MPILWDNKTSDRKCGDCKLCCKLVPIASLKKDMNKWCGYCNPKKGCTIYDSNTRPEECAKFQCLYLGNIVHRLPSKTKVVMYFSTFDHKKALYVIEDIEGNALRYHGQTIIDALNMGYSVLLWYKDKLHHCYVKED